MEDYFRFCLLFERLLLNLYCVLLVNVVFDDVYCGVMFYSDVDDDDDDELCVFCCKYNLVFF